MTPIQIAYFKHFLYDKGVQGMYISLYRSRRIKGGPGGDHSGNPVSLEQFLSEQPYSRVIMNAFYFITGSQYGYDYWKEINGQWMKYWDMNENNFSNEKYSILGGTFGILRQNWDSKEYWKPETKAQTYKRMGIEPPPGFEACSSSTLAESQVEEHSETPSEESDPLAGFTEVDTNKYNGNGRRIKDNTVTINLRNNGYRITFSANVSNKLFKKGYKFIKLLTNKNIDEVALMFNNDSGCSVSGKPQNRKHTNAVINSRDIVEHIHQFYGLKKEDDYYLMEITSTIEENNRIIFKLKPLK